MKQYILPLILSTTSLLAYDATEWELRREDGKSQSRDYTRYGEVILTEHLEQNFDINRDGDNHTRTSIVRTKTKEGKDTWILSIESKRNQLSGLSTGPEIKEFELYISDQNQDGEVDLITLMNRENRIFEAFTFIQGSMEPIPDELLADQTAFAESKLISLINQRLELVSGDQ
jgi:hypothetical protein